MRSPSIHEVREHAADRWPGILKALAPALDEAINRHGRHVPCPVHGGRDGFRLYDGKYGEHGGGRCNTCGHFVDGFILLMWVNLWTFRETVQEVSAYLGLVAEAPGLSRNLPRAQIGPPPPQKRSKRVRETLKRIWNETIPASDRIAIPLRHYFERRGIDLPTIPRVLRYHPALPYYHGDQLAGTFPTMLGLLQGPRGEPVSLHRTYLTHDGNKATPSLDGSIFPARKLMSPIAEGATRGAAIRLFAHDSVLGVAEGIETALAAHVLFGLPVWAAISAGGLAAVSIPDNVEAVTIFVDHDRNGAGQGAAIALARRLKTEGRQYRFRLPTDPGLDWNDVLMNGQKNAD